jgi:dihydroflavonol-4-reductase
VEGCDTVFHLAANPTLWAADPRVFHSVNTEGTATVLEAAAKAGVDRTVHTSTESILALARGRGIVSETTDPTLHDMVGAYTRSKLLAEQEAMRRARNGEPVVIVNPTLPVGPGDVNLSPPGRLILDFLNGRVPAYVPCVLNLIDVRDVAAGHILAAERGRPGERYILGNENLPVANFFGTLAELTGLRAPRLCLPLWAGWVTAAVMEGIATFITQRPPMASREGLAVARRSRPFDSSRAVRELGLTPRPVRQALADACAWFVRMGWVRRPLPRFAPTGAVDEPAA